MRTIGARGLNTLKEHHSTLHFAEGKIAQKYLGAGLKRRDMHTPRNSKHSPKGTTDSKHGTKKLPIRIKPGVELSERPKLGTVRSVRDNMHTQPWLSSTTTSIPSLICSGEPHPALVEPLLVF